MKSSALAARAAAIISASVASSRPYRMFSRIVPPNSVASCATRPIWPRRLATVTSRTSRPSIRIAPSVTSHRRGMRPVERGLARPGRPDQGEGLPCPDRQVDVAQDQAVGAVRERHAIELDPAGDAGHRPRIRRVDDRRPGVDDLEDAGDGPGPLSELAVQPGDGAEARGDGDAVQQEPGQRADPERRRR